MSVFGESMVEIKKLEKIYLTDHAKVLPNQVVFESFPQIIFDEKDDLQKEVQMPTDKELKKIIDKLHQRFFSKKADQKDLKEFYHLSKKVVEKFHQIQYESVKTVDLPFLKSVLKSLDFQRIYVKDSEKLAELILGCASLREATKKCSERFWEDSGLSTLIEDLTVLEEKLEFQNEYLKVEPKFLDIDFALEEALQKLNSQMRNLQTGEELNYNPELLISTLHQVEQLAQFYHELDSVILNKTAKLTYHKQIETLLKNAYQSVESFLNVYQKEYEEEIQKLASQILSHPSFTSSSLNDIENLPQVLDFVKSLKAYEALTESHKTVEKILSSHEKTFQTFIGEPKSWLGSIQGWTATLFNLHKSVLEVLFHPINSAKNVYCSRFEMMEGAAQFQIEKFFSLMKKKWPVKLCIAQNELEENIQKINLFQSHLLDSEEAKWNESFIKKEDLRCFDLSFTLEKRPLENRSLSQKAFLKKLDEPKWLTNKSKKIALTAVGFLALVQSIRYATSSYLDLNDPNFSKIVEDQIDFSDRQLINIEASRLESFLAVHGLKPIQSMPEALKNHPELAAFLENFYNPIPDALQNITAVVEEYKTLRYLQVTTPFSSFFNNLVAEARRTVYNTKNRPWEFLTEIVKSGTINPINSLSNEVFSFCNRVKAFLFKVQNHCTNPTANSYPTQLQDDVTTFSTHFHQVPDDQRQSFQVCVFEINDVLKNAGVFGLSENEISFIEKRFERIKEILGNYLNEEPEFPPKQHLSDLLNHVDLNFNPKLLIHIVGDPVAANTELESSFSNDDIQKFIDFLLLQKELGQTYFPTESLIKTLNRTVAFNNEYFKSSNAICDSKAPFDDEKPCFSKNQKERFENLSIILKRYLTDLEVGEPLVLLRKWFKGFLAFDLPHGASLEIYKETENLFRVRISNRGRGIKFHVAYGENGKNKIVPFIEKKNVPLEDLLDPIFVTAIYEMGMDFPKRDKELLEQRVWTIEHLYEGLISTLRGDFVLNVKDSDWVEPQISQLCMSQSLVQTIRNLVTKEQFNRFEAEFGIWALKSIFSEKNYLSNENKGRDINWQLLMKSLYAYSSSLTLKLEETPNLFTHEELALISQTLSEMRETLKAADVKEKTQSGNNKGSHLTSASSADKIYVPDQGQNFWASSRTEMTLKDYKTNVLINISAEMSVDQILEILPSISAHLDSLREQKLDHVALEFLDQLVEKIHLYDYKDYPPEKKEALITNLVNLTDELFFLMHQGDKKHRILPRRYLTALRISDILFDLVDKELAKDLGLEYPFKSLFLGIDKILMPHFTALDLKVEKAILAIKEKINKSAGEIPTAFPLRDSNFNLREEIDPILPHLDLTRIPPSNEFFKAVVLPSIARFIAKKSGSEKDLWIKVGNALKTSIYSAGMPEIWNKLIHQSTTLLALSEFYLLQDKFKEKKGVEFVDAYTKPFYIESESKKNQEPLRELAGFVVRYYGGGISYNNPNFSGWKTNLDTEYSPTHAKKVYTPRASLWLNTGGHLFEQNFPLINDDLLKYVMEYWQAHLFLNGLYRFNLSPKTLYANSLTDNVHDLTPVLGFFTYFNKLFSQNKPLVTYAPPISSDVLLEHLLIIKEPTLRIPRAISFFSNSVYADKIAQKDYQTFLYLLLFGDEELLNQFSQKEDAKALADSLANFLKTQYNKQVISQNISVATFLLRLNQKLNEYYCFTNPAEKENTPFLDTYEKIEELLSHPKISQKDLFYIHRARAAFLSAKDSIDSPEELADLLISYAKYKSGMEITGNINEFNEREDPILDQEIFHAIFKNSSQIKELILKNPSSLLNKVVKELGYSIDENNYWSLHSKGFPYFQSQKGHIIINLLEGEVQLISTADYKQGKALNSLPYEILSDSVYRRLFKDESYPVIFLGNDTYEFVDKLGDTYRVQLINRNNARDVNYSKLIEGQFCSYFPSEILIAKGISNFNFIKGYSHWQQRRSEEVYFFDIETGKQILHETNNKSSLIHDETSFELVNLSKTSLRFLSRFENSHYINVFKSGNHIARVEFPRLVAPDGKILSFYRENNRLKCLNYPNLYLSDKDFFFKNQYNSILLVNELEEPVKVLMTPYKNFDSAKAQETTALETNVPLIQEETDIDGKYDIMEYNVKENLDYKFESNLNPLALLPQSREASIYLAFTYLRAHEYESAAEILNSLRSSFVSLTENELELLLKIIQLAMVNGDSDPRSISVRMLASYIFLDNLTRFDTEISDSFAFDMQVQISANYEDYLKARSHVNLFELDPYHEFQILDYVFPSERIKSRKEELVKKINISNNSSLSSTESIIYLPDFGVKKISFFNLVDSFEKLFVGSGLSDLLKNLEYGNLQRLKEVSQLPIPTLPFYKHFTDSYNSRSENPSLIAPSSHDFLEQFIALYDYAKNYQNLKRENNAPFDLEKLCQFFSHYAVLHDIHGIIESPEHLIRGLSGILYLVAQYPNLFPETEIFNEHLRFKEKRNNLEDGDEKLAFFFYPLAVQIKTEMILSSIKSITAEIANSIINTAIDNELFSLFDKDAFKPLPSVSKPMPRNKKVEESSFEMGAFNLESYSAKDLMLDDLNGFLATFPQSVNNKKDTVISALAPMFSTQYPESFQANVFNEIEKDCHYYLNQSMSVAYALSDSEYSITEKMALQKSRIDEKSQELSKKEREILLLANRPDITQKEALKVIKIVAEDQKTLSIKDLLLIFMSQDPVQYHKANSALTPNEIIQLNQMVLEYLVESTYLHQLKRVEFAMKKVHHSTGADQAEWVQKLGEWANAKREYDIQEKPSYLVFEYFSEKLLYKKQVEKLKELEDAGKEMRNTQELGLIIEAIMGFGKSKIMLPLLSLHFANQNTLPILVMPDSLQESLGQEIKETVDDFNQKVKVIEFTRETSCTPKKLENLLLILRAAIENKEAVIFSSTSLQSMYLKYIELLYYANENRSEDLKAIEEFQKIFKILKEASLPVFDEADLLFNCRQETHFTLASSTKIREKHLDLSTLVFEIITEDDFMRQYNFNFLEFNSNSAVFTKENFEEDVKPYLANKIIERLRNNSDRRFATHEVAHFLNSLKENEKELLAQYLMGSTENKVNQFIKEIENEDVANIISLAQAQLNIFLPLTLNKRIFEHYGPSLQDDRPLAIPYHHGKPIVGSEFGNQYEVIFYTIQLFLKQGISSADTQKEVDALKNEAFEMLNLFPMLKLEDLNAFTQLRKIYPKATSFDLNEKEIQEATKNINDSNELKLYIIRKFFLPKVKIYQQRISSNPQVFKHLFGTVLGFTGTMWNAETFPNIETRNSLGILGNTLSQFITKSNPKVEIIENEEIALEQLSQIAIDQGSHAFIDLNGYFDFISKKQVAEIFLKSVQKKGLEGVAYYDASDRLVIMTDPTKEPILLSKSELEGQPEKRFTFYDHQRTTGADVSQAPRARALLSVGKHLILRDLAQAAWRMRGLEKGQAIDFVITKEDEQVMRKELNLDKDKAFTIEDIIAYSIQNQLKIKAGDNLLSQKQKIHAVFEKYALEVLFNQNLKPEEVIKFFHEFSDLFIQEVVDEPRLQFQKAEELVLAAEYLDAYANSLKNKYRFFFSPQDWKKIEREIKEAINLEILPSKILSSLHEKSADLQQNIQVMVQVETQKQLEVENQQKIQTFDPTCDVSKVKWSDALFNWRYSDIDVNEFMPKTGKNSINLSDSIFGSGGLTIVRLNSFLDKKFAFFSPKIFATSNLHQGLTSLFFSLPLVSQMSNLYKSCQNPCQEVLCMKTAGEVRLLMLDIHEAAEWKSYIQKNDQKSSKTSSSTLFMVNLVTGEIERPATKELQDELEEIKSSDEYKDLILEAKLLSGNIFLEKDEIRRLEQWLKNSRMPKQALKELIGDYVLNYRPTTSAKLENSPLGKLLNGLNSVEMRV